MEYYSTEPENQPEKKSKNRLSVGMGLFLSCVVLTALVGLFAGLLISNYTHDNYIIYAQAESSATATAAPVETASSDTGSSAIASSTTASAAEFAYDGAYTKAQIVEMCAPSVVGIDITYTATSSGSFWYGGGGSTYEATGSGSGVILTADGYIATCAHVVEDANTITVTLNDDTAYEATLIGTDSRNDIAIIKIDATGLTPAEIGDSDMLTVGEDVIAIGNPLGELRGTATNGIISATNRTVEVEGVTMTLVQTNAAISPGNSGGGLFDASGKLIGIVNAKVSSDNAEGLGFAIPVNNVITEINDLLNYGYVTGRAYLGVYTQNVTLRSDYGMWYNNAGTSCVQIADVVAGGAAELAGLKTGDLILKVGDTTISSNDDLSDAIGAYNAGDTAILTVQRSGEQFTVTVTFQEYVPSDTQ